jgi:hypothetical protein
MKLGARDFLQGRLKLLIEQIRVGVPISRLPVKP